MICLLTVTLLLGSHCVYLTIACSTEANKRRDQELEKSLVQEELT
jgi:hypothetical protein